MRLWMRFIALQTAHMFATGADMFAEVVAVEGCGPDLAVNAVQQCEYSTRASDRSRHACRIGCC